MAGLAFGLIAIIRELYAVTSAFVRCGCDVHKSLNYIRAKNRLRLFRKYCEAVWLQYEYESLIEYAKDFNSNNSRSVSISNTVHRRVNFRARMRRGRFLDHGRNAAIDFAATEATAMAREASEGYLMNTVESNFDDECDFVARELDYETFENPDDIEVVSGVEADISYYDHIDSHPQCRKTNLGELLEGVCFNITGRILLTCERFSINFLIENEKRDVALHINPRLPQDYIVRNTRVRNVWGHEEIATQLPFNLHRGTEFSIQVLITEESFMIASNGYHFADYKHRLPYRTIKAIEVKGDVEDVDIQREVVSSYPERQPEMKSEIIERLLETPFRDSEDDIVPDMAFYDTMKTDIVISKSWRPSIISNGQDSIETLPIPYIGCFKNGSLNYGRAIRIKGRVKLLPHSFYINLQDGTNTWPHQDIAFHFNPRFSSHSGATLGKAIVCRNAWYDGHWAKEERSELDTNLRPGKMFVLMIRCTHKSFKVYVDRKLITSFRYHRDPSIVNTVYVRGDVQLFEVCLLVPNLSIDRTESFHSIVQGDQSINENPSFISYKEENQNVTEKSVVLDNQNKTENPGSQRFQKGNQNKTENPSSKSFKGGSPNITENPGFQSFNEESPNITEKPSFQSFKEGSPNITENPSFQSFKEGSPNKTENPGFQSFKEGSPNKTENLNSRSIEDGNLHVTESSSYYSAEQGSQYDIPKTKES